MELRHGPENNLTKTYIQMKKFFIVSMLAFSLFAGINAQKFTVSPDEVVVTNEQMKLQGIREFDNGIYGIIEKENIKWFSSCSRTPMGQTVSVGPAEEPLEFICTKGAQIESFPNLRPDRDYTGNFAWIANVYDMKNGDVLAFIHCEESLNSKSATKRGGVYFRFGLAIAKNGGRDWKWLGYIIEPNLTFREWYMQVYPGTNLNVGYANYIIKDGYFQVYYRDNMGVKEGEPAKDGIAIARAKVDEVVEAAENGRICVWNKYYGGKWDEPGLGGKFTPLNIPTSGLMHGDAAYNKYLNKYVMAVRGSKWENVDKSEIKISFSDDGFTWSDWKIIHQDQHLNDYPTIISMGSQEGVAEREFHSYAPGDSNEITGKEFYVYFLCHYDKLMPEKFGKTCYKRVKITLD